MTGNGEGWEAAPAKLMLMKILGEDIPPAEDQPDGDEDARIIEKTARAVVERRLAAPALFLLESMRPLSFVASQGLLFLQPIVESILTIPEYQSFQRMLEKRENIERLVEKIEELEDERIAARAKKKQKKT